MSRKIIENFTPEHIMDRWENIFAWSTGKNEIIRNKGAGAARRRS
jgi:hypothetical protein